MNSDLDLPPSVRAALTAGLGEEPPLRLTVSDVIGGGRRARRRRRLLQGASGVGTAAVVGVVATVAAATLRAAAPPAGGGPAAGTAAVTFRAVTGTGATPTADQLQRAAAVLRSRLANGGIRPTTVAVAGHTIVVTAPDATVDQVEASAAPNVLRFRPVKAGPFPLPPTATPTGPRATAYPGTTPAEAAELAALRCGKPTTAADSASRVIAACSQDGTEKMLLGPAVVDSSGIRDARADPDQENLAGGTIVVTFTDTARATFADYSARHNAAVTPGNPADKIAFVLDGRVLAAPEIQDRIDGPISITGDFTQARAATLAAMLRSGTLPVTLHVLYVRSLDPTVTPDPTEVRSGSATPTPPPPSPTGGVLTDPPATIEPTAVATARLDAALAHALRLPPGARITKAPDTPSSTPAGFYPSQGEYKSSFRVVDPAGTGSVYLEVNGGRPVRRLTCARSLPAGTTCTPQPDGGVRYVNQRRDPSGAVVWSIQFRRPNGNEVSLIESNTPDALGNAAVTRPAPPLTMAQAVALLKAPGLSFSPPK